MSSNTNIGNTPVNQGYVQLIHTGETGGIDGTLRTLYDGDGTASDLQIASNKVKISTQLYIGSKTITEYVQDVVGDMLDTNGSHTNITATYDDDGDGAIDLVATGAISSITGGTGIDATGSGDITIAIDSTVATLTGTQTLTNKTLASPTFTGTANGANLTLTGDLTVSGDTIFTNSNTVLIGDAILTLNADETGSPTANAGFEVERGTSANKTFIWNETDDKWTIGSETFVASTVEANLTGNVTGNLTGNVTGDVTGNADTSTKIASITNSNIVQLTDTQTLTNKTLASPAFTGDIDFSDAATPQLNITDTTNTVTTRIQSQNTSGTVGTTTAHNFGINRNSVSHFLLFGQYTMHNSGGNDIDFRAKDSSGNVVFKVDAGTSTTEIGTLSVTGNATVTGDIIGDVTGNADTATKWANPREISLTGDITGVTGASGLDGSADVSIATTIANDSVALGTQTTGNYMENVSAGTGISVSHTPSEGSTATISTNDSAIVHDNLSGFVANEHIDWTTDQGATNIHAGNYTDTNQLTTFVIQDGDTTNVTIDQGKYVKFQALTNGGLDIDWASSLGAGSSGDPYDLQFKIDLSNMSALADTLESGDNLLVYNADEGTALAPVSEIQSALNIPSASGTTDGVVTLNANGTLTGESGLTYDTSTLALTGDFNVGSGDFFVDDSAGRVGIGTVSPGYKLDVSGDARFTGSLITEGPDGGAFIGNWAASSSFAVFGTANMAGAEYALLTNGTNTFLGSGTGGKTFFRGPANDSTPQLVNDGTNIYMQNAGNFGIGTTSPASKLHIQEATAGTPASTFQSALKGGLILEDDNTTTANNILIKSHSLGNDEPIGGIKFVSSPDGGNYSWAGIQGLVSTFAAAGQLAFYTAASNTAGATSTERMRIDSSGNVGIGVVSPLTTLDVQGQSLFQGSTTPSYRGASVGTVTINNNSADGTVDFTQGLVFTDNTNNQGAWTHAGIVSVGGSGYNGNLVFGTDGDSTRNTSGITEKMRISSSGNVGIGETNPTFGLQIDGADFSGDAFKITRGTSAFTILNANNSYGVLGMESDHDLQIRTDGTTRMTIDNDGKVGIGTASPLDLLHIKSSSTDARMVLDGHTGYDAELKFYEAGSSKYTIGHDSASGNFVIGTANVDTNQRLVINSSGNVGIGETSPEAKLHIKNASAGTFTASNSQLLVENNTTVRLTLLSPAANGCKIEFGDINDQDVGMINYDHSNNHMQFFTNALEAVRIDSSQDAHFDQDVIAFSTTPSDIRLKKNFTKIENGLDIVTQLEGHTFNWKKGGDRLSAGFKAQEVEKILPHLVDEKKLPLKADDDKEYKILRYEEMIPYLVEAIKQLKTEIEELKNG